MKLLDQEFIDWLQTIDKDKLFARGSCWCEASSYIAPLLVIIKVADRLDFISIGSELSISLHT